MEKFLPKDLKALFLLKIGHLCEIKLQDENPFLINLSDNARYVFLKKITSAYLTSSPDSTRIQLPSGEQFDKILSSNIPLLVMGYDKENDVVVGWNPEIVKRRINTRSNVSLYSRKSFQSNIKNNGFEYCFLKNGEKIIGFKLEHLLDYINSANNLFSSQQQNEFLKVKTKLEPQVSHKGAIFDINDARLILLIQPFIEINDILKCVEICINFYNGKFESMTFKNWHDSILLLKGKIEKKDLS